MPCLLQLLLLKLHQLRCISVQERIFWLILEYVLHACSDQSASGRNGQTQCHKCLLRSHGWGNQRPIQLQPDSGDRTQQRQNLSQAPRAPLPTDVGWRPSLQRLSGLPMPKCSAAGSVPEARDAAARKRGHCTHTCSQQKVLPHLWHAVPCTKPCFCQDPLSREQHLHGHAVPSAVCSTALAGRAMASPSCLISVLAAAAAALKDTDLSGSFISVLMNDQIDLMYRWKD